MSTFDWRTIITPKAPPPPRMREECLAKLRWSVKGSVEDIMVEDGLNQDGSPQLHPFLSHSLATEDIAIPPTSRTKVYSLDVGSHMFHMRIPDEHHPKPIMIEHEDGSSVTIKEFVIAAHECLSRDKDLIIKCRKFLTRIPVLPIEVPEPEGIDAGFDADEHGLFFERATVSSFEDGSMAAGLHVWLEGEMGKSIGTFWEKQRETAKVIARRREKQFSEEL